MKKEKTIEELAKDLQDGLRKEQEKKNNDNAREYGDDDAKKKS